MVPSAVLATPDDQPEPAPDGDADGATISPRQRARALVGVVPALLLLAVASWEIVAAARAGDDVPGDDAWTEASRFVRAGYQPGDLIVFAPSWLDPVGRMHLGDLMTVDDAARMDDARYAVVWEVSIRGAAAPEARGREVSIAGGAGGVRVRRLVREPAVVLTDFVERYGKGRRSVAIAGKPVGQPRVVLEEVGFAPHRCVRVEPRPDQTVRLTFRDVALGSSLVGYVGLADVFTRRDIRNPGHLEVFVDGESVASARFGVDDGWVRFSADTRPAASAQVTFAATAVGTKARKRLICFAAEARK